QNNSVRDDIFEGWAIEQCCTQYVHGVKPAASLANVFDNEVGWIVGIKPVFVFHRVMHLGVWHRSGVEPDIQDVIDPTHCRFAGGIIWVWPDQFIDPRTV